MRTILKSVETHIILIIHDAAAHRLRNNGTLAPQHGLRQVRSNAMLHRMKSRDRLKVRILLPGFAHVSGKSSAPSTFL